ncbi:MAG: tetratricopeptide repeat protein [Rickettsia conorii subsp. raoultii]|uniref:tetratricopeptide repeat protein n=1 Tax=Rickettsia conorii TaxID=781 RepID=UPI0029CABAA4|nr:tetratricopeptide repeat protein [Rickettsia conorii]
MQYKYLIVSILILVVIVICFCGYKFLFNKQPESVANDFEKELAECDKTIKQNPNDADSYIGYGFRLRILGLRFPEKYELALEAYNKAIEFNPNDAKAYFYKGLALDALQEYEEAI